MHKEVFLCKRTDNSCCQNKMYNSSLRQTEARKAAMCILKMTDIELKTSNFMMKIVSIPSQNSSSKLLPVFLVRNRNMSESIMKDLDTLS